MVLRLACFNATERFILISNFLSMAYQVNPHKDPQVLDPIPP